MENIENVTGEKTRAATFEQNILFTAKGGTALFIGKGLTIASRLAISLLLTHILGAEQYGQYNIALSAATLASGLALIGMDDALVRYISLYVSRHDEDGVWGSFQVALVIAMGLSTVMSITLFAMAYVIAVNVFHEASLAPILQLTAFIVPFLGLSDLLAGATRGFKHMEQMVIAQNIVQPTVRVILIVALALIGLNVIEAIIIYGYADITASLVLIYFLNKQPMLSRPIRAARREPVQIVSYSIPMWMSDMIGTFRSSIQTILLGSLNTVMTVGIFSVATQLNTVSDMVQSSVTTAVRPIIVEVNDRHNREQLGRIYQTVSKWLFAFNFPLFLIIVMFPSEILSIFGKTFQDGAPALVLMAWASVIDAGTGMCGAVIDMTGFTRLKLLNAISRLALVMVISVLLIPGYGMVGAAIAALLGEAVINALRLVQVFILFHILPYSPSFMKPILAGLVALLVNFAAVTLLSSAEVHLNVLLQMALLSGVYVLAVLAMGLDPEDRAILSRLRRRAGHKFSQIHPS